MTPPTCTVDPVFIKQEYSIPDWIGNPLINAGFVSQDWVDSYKWNFAPFQFHALMFAAFASVIGPFGGFFASGLKRSLGIKDFGKVFPGHGGWADRMDCQILTCVFVYVYRKSFVQTIAVSMTTLLQYSLNLPLEERINMMNALQRSIDAEMEMQL